MIASYLEQCAVFLPLSFGLFLSYCVLKITDLTVDGSFVVGAVIYALSLKAGIPSFFAVTFAMAAAGLCGVISALLQYRDRVPALMAGIIVSFSLYSLNLLLLGRPNVGLSQYPHLPDAIGLSSILSYATIDGVIVAAIFFLLKSELGLFLRAYGSNHGLLQAMGQNDEILRRVGLFITNALAGLSGVMMADLNDYVDCSMGQGLVLVGIGTVVIGIQFVRENGIEPLTYLLRSIGGVVLGVFIYFSLMMSLIRLGVDPFTLKLVLGTFLGCFMFIQGQPTKRGRIAQ